MSEIFNNYTVDTISSISTDIVVVPTAIAGENRTADGASVREVNSISQIHSIFISQLYNNYQKIGSSETTEHFISYADNPITALEPVEKDAVFFNLFITDSNNTKKYYIIVDGMVPYQNSFYLDKTITLKENQKLCINFIADAGKNPDGRQISIIASSADITS